MVEQRPHHTHILIYRWAIVTVSHDDIYYCEGTQMCILRAVTLGVPATSRILTGDSQKLSFSILRKVPFLIFWSDKPPRRTNSAHTACSRAGTWATWVDVVRRRSVSCVDKIYIFEILMKNCSKH